MSHDPYPSGRPDPDRTDPYSSAAPSPPPPYAYMQTPQPNTSAIVLTVDAGLTVVTGYCCPIGVVPLILGILGITNHTADPEGAARLTRIGWIVYAALTAIVLLGVAAFIITLIVTES